MAVTKVQMPKLSEAMESGKIIKWLKKEGDRVQSGDILAEVETDKADVEMEAFGNGVLRKILVPAGEKANVGALIGVIADPNEDISAVVAQAGPAPAASAGSSEESRRPAAVPPQPRREDHAERSPSPSRGPEAPARPTAPPPAAAGPQPASAVTAPGDGGGRVKASPLARKIAAQSGVDLKLVQGSGPGGRIVRRDVEAAGSTPAVTAGAAAPQRVPVQPGVEFEDIALTPMRATIAKRMPLSKGPVPHFYVTSEVAMDRAGELRAELNALDGSPKISVNDLVIRACALALMRHPGVNASLQGQAVRMHHRAHIGLAVALDAGLITPVLRDCDVKPLVQIAAEARDLADRARAGKLRASELSGATFTISNLGMLDVEEFSAIINPPEGAILAVGSMLEKAVVVDGALAVGRRMKMTISCDHRVMDGAMGARFLQDVKRLLEEPLRLLV